VPLPTLGPRLPPETMSPETMSMFGTRVTTSTRPPAGPQETQNRRPATLRVLTCGFVGAAYRNQTDDLFITRELHTHKALDWPAIAASTKTTQPGQNDQTEVMYAQNTPMRTPLAVGT
jgi:hypothetical protein